MPARTESQAEALYPQIRRRMIESGEWERLMAQLTQALGESGWLDDIKHRTKESARAMSPLSFDSLIEDIRPNAESSVSLSIKQEMMTFIRRYLNTQLES